jgi:hypothetical protein
MNDVTRILIIGCGVIGSRHLQSILQSKIPLIIDVVEPNKKSKLIAESIIDNQQITKFNHQIHWHVTLSEIKYQSDLTIVSTLASNRVNLIIELLKMGNSRFLIEKMVCQSKKEYDLLLTKIKLYGAKAWVNCPRRYFSSYKKIKKILQNSKNLHVNVHSGNIGLGSNAIHFLDLFSWFIDDTEITLDGNFLTNQIFVNKRGKDLVEFQGTVIANNHSNYLSINFSPYDEMPQTIDITGKNIRIQINETLEEISVIHGNKNNLNFNIEFQSTLTLKMMNDILKKDISLLPSIQDSYFIHCELFRIFNLHLTKILNKKLKLCPIT